MSDKQKALEAMKYIDGSEGYLEWVLAYHDVIVSALTEKAAPAWIEQVRDALDYLRWICETLNNADRLNQEIMTQGAEKAHKALSLIPKVKP